MSFNAFMKGCHSEWVALRWLIRNYPNIEWRECSHIEELDRRGIDILGRDKDFNPIKVQVKSSVASAEEFINHPHYKSDPKWVIIVSDEGVDLIK